jgi:hypothetical protein
VAVLLLAADEELSSRKSALDGSTCVDALDTHTYLALALLVFHFRDERLALIWATAALYLE